MNFSFQDLTNISGIITSVVTAFSVIILYFTYRHNKRREYKQKACDLAKYYADNFINKITYICIILASNRSDELLSNCFKPEDIYRFDYEELKELEKKHGIKDSTIFNSINTIQPEVIFKAKIRTGKSAKENNDIYDFYSKKLEAETAAGIQNQSKLTSSFAINSSALVEGFHKEIIDLLNELEWFSMNFVYKLADEKLVYTSLHQTYLSNIVYLYYFICVLNKDKNVCDKLYKNIIKLYNKWRNRLTKDQKHLQTKLKHLHKHFDRINPM